VEEAGGGAGEAERHGLAAGARKRMGRRLAQDRGVEGVGHDEPGAVGQDFQGHGLGDGEEEAVAEIAVVRPFPVGPEVGDARLDLDDGEAAVGRERDHVGAAPARQRELGQCRVAEPGEESTDSALDPRGRRRLASINRELWKGCNRRIHANKQGSGCEQSKFSATGIASQSVSAHPSLPASGATALHIYLDGRQSAPSPSPAREASGRKRFHGRVRREASAEAASRDAKRPIVFRR
jgi:hypothetical protein